MSSNLAAVDETRHSILPIVELPESLPILEHAVGRLRRLGVNPATIVDVGAGEGTWSLYEGFPDAAIVAIEPLREYEALLQRVQLSRGGTVIRAAVLDYLGTGLILKQQNLAASTLIHGLTDKPGLEPVDVSPLDELFGNMGWRAPILLNIDCEGSSLDILRRATAVLRHTQIAIVEAPLFKFWHSKQGDFSEIVDFMRARNFTVIDIVDQLARAHDGALGKAKIVFLKKGSLTSDRDPPRPLIAPRHGAASESPAGALPGAVRQGSDVPPAAVASRVVSVRNGMARGWLQSKRPLSASEAIGLWVDGRLVGFSRAHQSRSGRKGTRYDVQVEIPRRLRDGAQHALAFGLHADSPPSPVSEETFVVDARASADPFELFEAKGCASTKGELGILLFGHTRGHYLTAILDSLQRQNALQFTHVWLDGHQGKPNLKKQCEDVVQSVGRYPVARIHANAGNLGFRKMMIIGLTYMMENYDKIIVLEDDCFPTAKAVEIFSGELDLVRNDDRIFSVYGHPFLMECENETCPRFQGWGWGTTSRKLGPVLKQLVECFSLSEEEYLEYVSSVLTEEVKARIDVTPPRQPSFTISRFFAWDETVCLLTALRGQVHKPTSTRTIYNFGVGEESTHFENIDWYRKPPFNMVPYEEIWDYFDR